MTEFAPGIPQHGQMQPLPSVNGADWQYVLHDHAATRAGTHSDLRLSDGKTAFSWAVRKGLPAPGEKYLAVRQSDHTPEYMQFTGDITSGYGKGRVMIGDAGPVRIVRATPDKIVFTITGRRDPEELALIDTGNGNWLLNNITPTTTSSKLPLYKPKFYTAKDRQSLLTDDRVIFQPKYDGAHVLLQLGKTPKLFSYRPSLRSDRLINHTYKIPDLDKVEIPEELRGSVLRGELYGVDDQGQAIAANSLAGLLNTDSVKSQRRQRDHAIQLRLALFDIDRAGNHDLTNENYAKKLQVLQYVADKLGMPQLELPEVATNEIDKKQLLDKIKQNRFPKTKEGVVAWHLDAPGGKPTKIKIRPDYDVYVRDIFPIVEGGKAGKAAGGFTFSHTPTGPIVGRIGTGFSQRLRDDLWQHPEKYIGRVAKVTAQQKFMSGALRAPAFVDWHLDKGLQPETEFADDDNIKQAASRGFCSFFQQL